MRNLLYVVSSESKFGEALWGATAQTDPQDFLPFIDKQQLLRQSMRFFEATEMEALAPKDPTLTFLDEVGERQEVNPWCDLITIHRGQAETLMRQYFLARYVTWEAEKRCFDEGIWFREMSQETYSMATLLTPCNKSATAIAYAYLASLEPDYGAELIIYNGKELLTQMEWFNRFAFDGDDAISWPQEWTEVLVVRGFQGLLGPEFDMN